MSYAPSQFAWRSQKAVGIYSGPPSYESLASNLDQDLLHSECRTFQYSPDGSLLAYAFDSQILIVETGNASGASGASAASSSSSSAAANGQPPTLQCKPLHTFDVEKVVDLHFSPRGRYLSTWQRLVKDADGNGAPNLHVFDCQSGECVGSFERKNQSGCHFQFTHNEDACVRMVTNELHVLDPQGLDKGVIGRLRLEGMTSYEVGPGGKPSVAVFVGERKGAPASVRIYPLASLLSTSDEAPAPISQKTFFKADKVQMKWNTQGTALLFVTSTDHDKTGKSYYGETNLYMMSTRGDFDCRVALDKEGPVHDFEWNPNGREFVVVYGYMPSKCTLFSYRINVIAELGTASRNFIAFNPQGRLFCVAGFGNLSGTVDVWDREKLGTKGASLEANAGAKLFSFDASNSSLFQWSPDGQFILTATLSPRLRVDNGVRIWHCSGSLIHIDMRNELYQASWRPMLPTEAIEKYPFPRTLPSAPPPSPAAAEVLKNKKSTSGTGGAGAYRPPGARHLPPGELRKLEEPASGSSSGSEAYLPPGAARNRQQGGKRSVPGAAASPGAAPQQQHQGGKAGGGKKGGKQQGARQHEANGGLPPAAATHAATLAAGNAGGVVNMAADVGGTGVAGAKAAPVSAAPNGHAAGASGPAVDNGDAAAASAAAGGPGAIDKKIRNLSKKLKAIQELKEKRDRGEKLEQTQLQKISSEAGLRKELAALE